MSIGRNTNDLELAVKVTNLNTTAHREQKLILEEHAVQLRTVTLAEQEALAQKSRAVQQAAMQNAQGFVNTGV